MSRTATVKIMDDLLAGQEISAKAYASRHHVSDTMVTGVLKSLGTALTRREESIKKGRRGCKQVWYRMKDEAAVKSARAEAARRKSPNQYTNKGLRLIDLDFDPLLQCWGISKGGFGGLIPKGISTFVHRIHTRADDMEDDESCAAIAELATTA